MGDAIEAVSGAFEQLGTGGTVAALVALLLLVLLGRQRGPRAGEFWMADVPFRSGGGSKDRPCLVVERTGRTMRVLYVTSQDRSRDDRYVPVGTSGWTGGVRGRRSWMQVAERDGSDPCLVVPRRSFRRRLGQASAGERSWAAAARRR